ncbi:N-acetyl sugar amidotransferase [Acidobacteria bacterium AB60]|nr:N-acetyl sugar amidotransferase [Acidobacteria bacterium AB60]
MQRCSRCILPETYPDITFDTNGVCHKCHEYDLKYASRDYAKRGVELTCIAEWARRQGKRFDCIVPFSGGKDSSYTLYVCRKQLGLKVLAVNFNNGLRTPEALINIEHICQVTDSAFVCYGPSWQTMRKLYRAFFLATGQFCVPCDMGIWATVHRVAEQYDVPLIVSGFSAQIESRGPKIYSYNDRLFQTIASRILTKDEMRDFLSLSPARKIARRLKRGRVTRYRRQISLPEYMNWDDAEIKRVISQELGWTPRADGSSDHIDCCFAPMKGYFNVQKWGFGEKTTKYAAMTRHGEITRDEALTRAQRDESRNIDSAIADFKRRLDVTSEEMVAAKSRTHLEFL